MRNLALILTLAPILLVSGCADSNVSEHQLAADAPLQIRYEPFTTVPLISPEVRGFDTMHDVTSLWIPTLSELVEILQRAQTSARFDAHQVRLIIFRGTTPIYLVDAFGTVQRGNVSRRLSPDDLSDLLLWIYVHTPTPDAPLPQIAPELAPRS